MKSRLLAALLCTLIVVALPAGANAVPIAHSSAVCADFANQAAAQAAANTTDADGDGVYCESLPCPCAGPGSNPTSPPAVTPPPSPVFETPPPQRRAQTIRGNVTKVIDGDTIKVRGRRRYTVRIIGIDTPETRRPGVSIECGGSQSSASMKRLAPVGSRVLLRTDPSQQTRDRYGRLLAYVQRKGKDLGRMQVDRGQATVYIYGGRPFARAAAYVRSHLAAKAAGRGVWSRCGGDFHSGS